MLYMHIYTYILFIYTHSFYMYRYTPADLRSLGLVKALLSCLSRWHSREVMPTAARMGALPPEKAGLNYYLRKYKNKMK